MHKSDRSLPDDGSANAERDAHGFELQSQRVHCKRMHCKGIATSSRSKLDRIGWPIQPSSVQLETLNMLFFSTLDPDGSKEQTDG